MAVTTSYPAFKVSGPIHHFVQPYTQYGSTAAGLLYYLGTAEIRPQVRIQSFKLDAKNDLAGRLLPMQTVYQGKMAQIGLGLNRFSSPAMDALRSTGGVGGIYQGKDFQLARGSLEFLKHTFQLWQVYGFYNWTTPATGVDYIPPGRYWPNVRIAAEDEQRIGTEDWLKLLVLEAYGLPVCASGLWTHTLWSQETADFPVDVQTPIC